MRKVTYETDIINGENTIKYNPYIPLNGVSLPGYEGYSFSPHFSYHWTPRDLSKFDKEN